MFFKRIIQVNIAGRSPEGRAKRGPRAKRGVAGALFTGIPLGCVAASYFKKDEDCCYATQWETKNEDCCYATQWDTKKGRLLLRNPMGLRTVIYKDKHLLLRNPMGHPV